MSEININGTVVRGTNIVILNGKVIVDGKSVKAEGQTINITVQGNIEKINADICNTIQVAGDAGEISTASGSVEIHGDVKQSVKTSSGDVKIQGDVGGSVSTSSGDIKCKDVSGNASTVSGDIN